MVDVEVGAKAAPTSEDMSRELKRLLSIQDRPAPAPAPAVKVEAVAPSNKEKSMALLALLRNNANGPTSKQEQNIKISPSLPVPPASSGMGLFPGMSAHHPGISPHHTPNPLQSLNAGPSIVPVPSSHFVSDSQQNLPRAQQQPSGYPFPSSANMPPPLLQKQPQPAPHTFAGAPHIFGGAPLPYFDGPPVHAPVVPKELDAHLGRGSYNVPEHHIPIQSTAPQFTTVHSPTIPTPSQLPPPKLTTHSMHLLNVLKNGQRPRAADQMPLQMSVNGTMQTTEAKMPVPFPNVRDGLSSMQMSGQSREPAMPVQSSPAAAAQPKPAASGNKSTEHRQNLLSLFRTPSVTPGEVTEGVTWDGGHDKPVVTAPTTAAILPPLPPIQASRVPPPLSLHSGINGQVKSNTTTSQAHKEFLLGYLDTITNKSKAKA